MAGKSKQKNKKGSSKKQKGNSDHGIGGNAFKANPTPRRRDYGQYSRW
jgi:hypothetical protein